MSRVFGYLRTNTNRQDMQVQLDRLKAAGATKVYREKALLVKQKRPQLDKLLNDLRKGDRVMVTSLDRIACNTRDLLEIVESLNVAEVALNVLDDGIDTSAPQGENLCTLLRVIIDFEQKTKRERQAEGIAKAKKEGRYKGRKPTAMAKTDKVLELDGLGLTRQKIADQLSIGVASVYRILKNAREHQNNIRKVQKEPVAKKNRAGHKKQYEQPVGQLSLF